MSLYLVTGGAGFIGSNIVEELVNRGEKVRVLDNFSTGKRENIQPFLDKIELIEGDIRSYHIVHEAMKGVDYVLHQAALPSVPRSVQDPVTTNEVNVTGTLHVLDAAKEANVKRLVFASSSSIYGNSEVLPKTEDMAPNPLSPYAVAKLAGEKYCQVFYRVYGLPAVALRYFNVFGPRQDPASQYSAVIPKFVSLMKAGKTPTIYGDGQQSRDFTYIQNVVSANLLACQADAVNCSGEVFNIACNQRITLNELVSTINKLTGKMIEPKYDEARVGDVKHSQAGIEKAKKDLKYQVVKGFEEGLGELVG
ncbi:SDR family oxidoreductase [bacterium]|nr:SDR family oxidoreductase [bacterium]